MLNVPWLLIVMQVFGQLLVGEVAAEPCVPPEEKGHQDDQPPGGKKQNLLGA